MYHTGFSSFNIRISPYYDAVCSLEMDENLGGVNPLLAVSPVEMPLPISMQETT